MRRILLYLAVLGCTFSTLPALTQRMQTPLAGAPTVDRRVELLFYRRPYGGFSGVQ